MIEPTDADIGRKVIYTVNRYPGGKAEIGVINGFNRDYVFVRYSVDIGAKATLREDLEWDDAQARSISGQDGAGSPRGG